MWPLSATQIWLCSATSGLSSGASGLVYDTCRALLDQGLAVSAEFAPTLAKFELLLNLSFGQFAPAVATKFGPVPTNKVGGPTWDKFDHIRLV